MWERDLLYEGHKVVPYCARCGTALSSHEVAQGYKDVEDPSVYVRFPVTQAGRRAARGRRAAGLDDDAVDARLQRGRRRRPRAHVRAHGGRRGAGRGARRSACWARASRSPTASRRASMLGAGYEPPFPFIPAEATARRATPCCPATSSPPRTAPASSTPRSPSARTTSGSAPSRASTVVNPVRLDGTYDERIGPYAGPLGQGRRPRPDRGPARARPAAALGDVPARLPALLALRHAADLLRQAVLVHPHLGAARPPAGRQRDGRLVPAAHQARPLRQVAGEQRRLGDLARALLGHAAARLALRERPRRGARLARRGAGALGPRAARPAPALRRRAHLAVRGVRRRDAPRARGDRRLVRLGLDAVRPAPRAVRERGAVPRDASPPTSSARRSTRRAAGSTRCSRSRRCCSTAAPYRTVLCLGHIADPQGKKMSKSLGNIVVPWDVIHQPRRRRVPLVLPDLQAAMGRLPVLDRDGRRVRAPVPAPALEHLRLLRALRERERRRRAGRAGDRARPLGDLAPERDDRRGARADGGLRRHARRPGDRCVRRRALELVRAALAPALLGRRPGRRSGRCKTCLVDGREAARAVHAVRRRRDLREPRRLGHSDGRSVHLADFPEPGERDVGAGDRDGRRARDRPPRPGGARRTASSRCASRCAPPSWSRRARSARRSSASRDDRAATSSTSRSCASSREADELGSYEVKPNYRSLGPRFGKQMPQVAAAVAALEPAHVAAALRDGGRVGDQRRRPRPRARRRRPDARDAAARGLPARARGLARRRARAASSTRSCGARASRARSCTRCRTRARARGCRSRTGSSWSSAATRSCWRPPATTRPTSPRRRSRSASPSTAPAAATEASIEGRPLLVSVTRA